MTAMQADASIGVASVGPSRDEAEAEVKAGSSLDDQGEILKGPSCLGQQSLVVGRFSSVRQQQVA